MYQIIMCVLGTNTVLQVNCISKRNNQTPRKEMAVTGGGTDEGSQKVQTSSYVKY